MSINNTYIPHEFFQGVLLQELSKYKTDFTLNLENYDITDDIISQIEEIILNTTNLNELCIRLSNTLEDKDILYKFLKKVGRNSHIKKLSFFIKYLDYNLYEVFLNYLSNANINHLKITMKNDSIETDRQYVLKLLQTLIANNKSIKNLKLNQIRIDTEEIYNALNSLLENKKYESVLIANNYIYNNNLLADISNISEFSIINRNLHEIKYLPLKKLDLSYNNISLNGISIISNLLSKSTTLEKLNLSYNYIGNKGCKILSEGIANNKSLISINLEGNHILDLGCEKVAMSLTKNKTIKKINLSNNYISDSGIIKLCEILDKEQSDRFNKIKIDSNCMSDEGILSYSMFLNIHNTVNSLIFKNLKNKIGDKTKTECFNYLKSCNNLEYIIVYNSDLSENNLSQINQILLNNKSIDSIDFSYNKITNTNLITKGIDSNQKLTKLNLNNCNLGNDGISALSEVLFNNINITELQLNNNNIGLSGIKDLCSKVIKKTSLKKLFLDHNEINHLCAYEISQGLSGAFGLEVLSLNVNKIKDEGCEYIAKAIKKNNTLKELYLDMNEIGNKGIRLISTEIKNKPKFYKLSITENKITKIDDNLYSLFNTLEEINIGGNPLNYSNILRIFYACKNNILFKRIRLFDLDNNTDNDTYKTTNLNCPYLKSFDLAYNKLPLQMVKNILNFDNISNLNLADNNLNDDSVEKLCSYISDSCSLKTLILVNNKFGLIGAQKIAEMLSKNKSLKELNISSNKIQYTGIKDIFNNLINNTNLEILYMNNTKGVNDYCADDLYQMIINNKTLLSLNIMGNYLTDKKMDLILSGLRLNKHLKILSIGHSYSSSKGFKNIDKYLSMNTSLKLLEIKDNNLCDYPFINKLKKVLKYNKNLISINLINNELSFNAISKLSLYLNKNYLINDIKLLLNSPDENERKILMANNSHIVFN